MKKQFVLIVMLSLLVVGFNSCKKDSFEAADLYGKWQAPSESDIDPQGHYQYCIFYSDAVDGEEGYHWGKMWDEGDEVSESDMKSLEEVKKANAESGLIGGRNGYFRWKLDKTELLEIHLMEYGWADIVKSYTVTVLTSSTLTYKDTFGKTHTYTK